MATAGFPSGAQVRGGQTWAHTHTHKPSGACTQAYGRTPSPPPRRTQVPSAASQLTKVLAGLRHTFVVADATLPDMPLIFASEGCVCCVALLGGGMGASLLLVWVGVWVEEGRST